jgi:hypothetical protein
MPPPDITIVYSETSMDVSLRRIAAPERPPNALQTRTTENVLHDSTNSGTNDDYSTSTPNSKP